MFHLSKSHHVNFLKIYYGAKHLYDEIPLIKKKRRRRKFFRLFKYLAIFFVLFIFLFAIFIGKHIAETKDFYRALMAGKEHMLSAVAMLRAGEYEQAAASADLAEKSFSQAEKYAATWRQQSLLSHIGFFSAQIDDLQYLLQTAKILSRAFDQVTVFSQNFDGVFINKKKSFLNLTPKEKRQALEKLYESAPELNGLKATLDLASLRLNDLSYRGVFLLLKPKILEYKKQLDEARVLVARAVPMSQILPGLLGYPNPSSYLFILQNSDELRPTGGFIGTYGIVELANGDILRFDTHDVYHLDMPVKDKFKQTPPSALKKYLQIDNWYLRDANWSPSWPESAQKISEFYYKEDKLLPAKDQINNFNGQFNGVIGITPQVITDLLSLVGPVVVEGVEYNSDNFTKLLQYRVEKGYVKLGVSSWQRKEVIGDIAKELKFKIFDLPPLEMYNAIKILQKNLLQKNILLYFNDKDAEDIVLAENWGGEILPVKGDYLLVVDANLASFKTDAVMKKGIDYQVRRGFDGLVADLTLNYAHNGGFDWRTTRYQTFTRVYVPLGSTLISVDGQNKGDVQVYKEFNRTVFAAYVVIEPGKIGKLHLRYNLPNNIINANEYSLYIQKQPGNNIGLLTVDIDLGKNINSYGPTGFFARKKSGQNVRWETDLTVDKEFFLNRE